MTAISKEILGDAIIHLGRRIKSGRCELEQEQMDRIFNEIENATDIPVSKEQACSMLGVSRSTFDAKVASGKIPKGRHRRGFKELVWFKRELQGISLMLCFILLFAGCSPKVYPAKSADSTSVVIRERIIRDTVTVTVQPEKEVIVTEDTVSILENTFAKSSAAVVSGKLHHSLETKKQNLRVPLTTTVHDTIVVTKQAETIVKEVPAKLNRWQIFSMMLGRVLGGLLISIIILWIVIKFLKR